MINIRPAAPADLSALLALVQRAYRGEAARAGWTHEADLLDGQRTDADALGAALASPSERIVLAEEDEALIGCVQVTDKSAGLASLGLLSVDPARQAGGLGRRLIAAAEQAAREAFASTAVEMTVIAQRAELIAWYERRGYVRTGERRPFPLDDPRFGLPRTHDLAFVVLCKTLAG